MDGYRRRSEPSRLPNFLATSRGQCRFCREAIARCGGQRKLAALGAFYTIVIELAEDETGGVRRSDASIAKHLEVGENTWYALRDILLRAHALERVETLRTGHIDVPITYMVPCMAALSSRVTPSRLDAVTTSTSEAVAGSTASTVGGETRETASTPTSSSEAVDPRSPAETDPLEVQEGSQELREKFMEGRYIPPPGPGWD
jgi:hypothetical protein